MLGIVLVDSGHEEMLTKLLPRFDGWVLPDGNIWFCDFNPLSGMEQNSFILQQAARMGMTHSDVLLHILEIACQYQKIKNFPKTF